MKFLGQVQLMGATMLWGKEFAARIKEKIKEEVCSLKSSFDIQPGLAVLLVGDNPASKAYVNAKIKACKETGIFSLEEVFPFGTSEEEIRSQIYKLNERPDIHGILVQLPLPNNLCPENIMIAIDPRKDVDGFHPFNRGNLVLGKSNLIACTPLGVIELLKANNVQINGKHAVIVGRSNIVGKPLASLFLEHDATVTICHSKTSNLKDITLQADILVLAMGRPHAITADYVSENSIVVDVGFTRINGKAKGDAAPCVAEKALAITPVPGGVGPMTIAMLLRNTITATKLIHNIK